MNKFPEPIDFVYWGVDGNKRKYTHYEIGRVDEWLERELKPTLLAAGVILNQKDKEKACAETLNLIGDKSEEWL